MFSDTVAGNYKFFYTSVPDNKYRKRHSLKRSLWHAAEAPGFIDRWAVTASFSPAFSSVFKGICQNIMEG